MKKTCKGCYAADKGLYNDNRNSIIGCTLGYRTINGMPNEECPKPKSKRQFLKLKYQKENEYVRKIYRT